MFDLVLGSRYSIVSFVSFGKERHPGLRPKLVIVGFVVHEGC